MWATYAVHIVAGSAALLAGYVALFAAKGAGVHRKSGMVFVYAMLTMCAFGFVLALGKTWQVINVPAAIMTAYLVVTSLATIRPPATGSRLARWLPVIAMSVAFVVGMTMLTFGVQAVANGGNRNGIPAFPFFLFGFVGLVGSAGDLRVLRSGVLAGAPRLARHLWRMTFALFIAAMSFFIGQMKVIPKPIRIPGLLALPVVVVLASLLYWMWRVRLRRSLRGLIVVGTPKAV
ncbi:MAG TPA: hypothetical protein VFT29_13550 [Gemmatimonadaceae bacterium]|nr:hypothetical protein [Gemmatimonadaceae bacterium]